MKAAWLVMVAIALVPSAASARVRHEGAWPDADKTVTLDADGVPRAQAVRKLAEAAGWSVVVHAPPGDPVDVHVKDQPAPKVLDLLLSDGDYVARRDGALVSIDKDVALPPAPASSASASTSTAIPTSTPTATPSVSATPSASATATPARGDDRTVMGGSLVIPKGEAAHDVTVMGGNLDVYGDVTGSITLFGGNARVHEGARVAKDCTLFGGNLSLDDGARIDGHVGLVGGHLHRAPGAHVGDVSETDDDDDDTSAKPGAANASAGDSSGGVVARFVSSLSHGVRLAAVLFVLGTVLLALAGKRMDVMRAEVATRPMRSIALGLVGALTAAVVFIALCVTLVGIPIAIVGAIVFGFGVIAAMCAALSVVGEALLRHRTENPYMHLALGCALFVGVAWVPWIGKIAVVTTVLLGIGVLVATRIAGFAAKKNGQPVT